VVAYHRLTNKTVTNDVEQGVNLATAAAAAAVTVLLVRVDRFVERHWISRVVRLVVNTASIYPALLWSEPNIGRGRRDRTFAPSLGHLPLG